MGWEPVVTVNSNDEQVRIFMLINGMTRLKESP